MTSDKKLFAYLSFLLFISGLFDYRSFVNRMEYVFLALILFVAIIHILKNTLSTPKGYIIRAALYIFISIIASVLSIYCSSFIQFFIGIVVALIPFIYFIASYNYNFRDNEIVWYIDKLITIVIVIICISLIETFVLHSARLIVGFVGSSIFWFQYLASISNQTIILCLALYKLGHKKKYKYFALICILYTILSIQLKTYVGLIIIYIGYVLIFSKKNTIGRLAAALLSLAVIGVFIMQIPQVSRKVEHYSNIYIVDNDGVARTELYNASIKIAIDHMPFGSGQGTFGSIPSNLYDSDVYNDYRLEYVWGLSKYDDVNFRMDTHWASIIGENGFLGTALYLILFLFPLIKIRKYKSAYREYYFIITMCYIVTIVESITLNLVARVPFIVIYSGISALILRQISSNHKGI